MKKLKKRDANYYRLAIEKNLEGKVLNAEELTKNKGILYGTFGYHDCEPPHSIIDRKRKEPMESTQRFGLWGTSITGKGFEKIQLFCRELEESNNDVFLFLKFTDNLSQIRSNDVDRTIWSFEKVKEDGNIYTHYFHNEGDEIKIPEKIIVKGSSRQNIAFVFDDIYRFEGTFDRRDMLSYFNGSLYNSDIVKSAEELFTISPCFLLTKKSNLENKTFFKEGNEWGIVLKLKYPYIVKCVNKTS